MPHLSVVQQDTEQSYHSKHPMKLQHPKSQPAVPLSCCFQSGISANSLEEGNNPLWRSDPPQQRLSKQLCSLSSPQQSRCRRGRLGHRRAEAAPRVQRETWLVWYHEEDHAWSRYRLTGSGSVGSTDRRFPLGPTWHTAPTGTPPASNPHLCSLGMGLGNMDTNNETCRAVRAPDKGPEQL